LETLLKCNANSLLRNPRKKGREREPWRETSPCAFEGPQGGTLFQTIAKSKNVHWDPGSVLTS